MENVEKSMKKCYNSTMLFLAGLIEKESPEIVLSFFSLRKMKDEKSTEREGFDVIRI